LNDIAFISDKCDDTICAAVRSRP